MGNSVPSPIKKDETTLKNKSPAKSGSKKRKREADPDWKEKCLSIINKIVKQVNDLCKSDEFYIAETNITTTKAMDKAYVVIKSKFLTEVAKPDGINTNLDYISVSFDNWFNKDKVDYEVKDPIIELSVESPYFTYFLEDENKDEGYKQYKGYGNCIEMMSHPTFVSFLKGLTDKKYVEERVKGYSNRYANYENNHEVYLNSNWYATHEKNYNDYLNLHHDGRSEKKTLRKTKRRSKRSIGKKKSKKRNKK